MSDPYIGEIRMFGGNFAPVGWLLCQGQTLPISDYDALFNLIGTTYGGDGQQSFALPNLQSRIPIHVGSGFPLGQTGGAETVTLNRNQLPIHTHQPVAAAVASSQSPNNNFWASYANMNYSPMPPAAAMAPNALSPSGGNQPHENMPPFLAINFIIATEGIYPPPN
ncbi:MAG TPA: tail fiber protein [Jatrophihabitans sp.]|jgi:microcystin-dependent protein|uniref:phage tail protein n=1 Tax=Jatrophihabitans sp. TaxID=1932789 RepID=UPI002EE715EE